MAESQGVDIRTYNIIYKLIESVELALHGLLEPQYADKVIGVAEVRRVIRVPRIGEIAGSLCAGRDDPPQRQGARRARRARCWRKMST